MTPTLSQIMALAAVFDPDVRKDTPVASPDEDFHMHLKRCKQCADHPFNLCVTGDRLIAIAGEKLAEEIRTGGGV